MASWKRFAMILLGWYPIIAPPRATQGVFHPDFSALVSDRVRLRLFDRASQWRPVDSTVAISHRRPCR
jgi:hypothetical protein